jgi:hypothetical protein
MGRPKGSRNKKGRIEYPRKCEHCDYVSNNPSMYHYHKRTHEEIPEGQLCDHGCNQYANFKGTGGIYTCTKNAHHCPAYLKRHSKRVKSDWKDNDERRKLTRQKFIDVVFSDEIRKKTIDAIKARAILKAEDAKDYRAYARKCRRIAQQWARDNGYEIGRQTYHVDHRLSLVDAYYAKLDVEIASHPANLQILPANENVRKWANSEITVEQLLEEIRKS